MFNSVSSFAGTKNDTLATFLSKTWMYFGLAILTASFGAAAGPYIINAFSFWTPYILFMVLMFTQGFWINSPTWSKPMFFIFAFASGTILYPTLAYASMTGQIMVVVQALVASSATFFAAALFGYTTKKDLSAMAQFLFMTMIGVFIASIINIFLANTIFSLVISAISVVLFAGYTAYDLQAIKNGWYSSPLQAALSLYINMFAMFNNFLNLFLSRD